MTTDHRGTDAYLPSVEAVLDHCGAAGERETLRSAIDLRLAEARREERLAQAYERAQGNYDRLAHTSGDLGGRGFAAHADASRRLMLAHRTRGALCLEEVRILVRHLDSCTHGAGPHG